MKTIKGFSLLIILLASTLNMTMDQQPIKTQNLEKWSRPRQVYKTFLGYKSQLIQTRDNLINKLFSFYNNQKALEAKKITPATNTTSSINKASTASPISQKDERATSAFNDHNILVPQQDSSQTGLEAEKTTSATNATSPINEASMASPISQKDEKPSSAFNDHSIHVLQQDSSKEWILRGKPLETNDNQIHDTPGLLWKDVRMQEGLNCGYHALKNISIILQETFPIAKLNKELQNPSSEIRKSLMSRDFFLNYIGSWAGVIHGTRKLAIVKNLHLAEPYPDNFKDQRTKLGHQFLKDYVDINTGRIKTNDLYANEVQQLINFEFPELTKNIVVFDDIDNLRSTTPGKKTLQRLEDFKKANTDKIGIVYTEHGFNHWVGYVALKENGEVNLYCLNSISAMKPSNIQPLINLIKS